ncbi:tripartite tricarboxylate transporter substrate binding protein [Ramlibacter sp. G-1-2-2]|uniref:Tripartite tricarboxylate transporter substrate binding protein n=1 Tax=Ramlibacter agri TaxID=2728837 RepID=A0A848H965_9BURK|nr:tripartite tricarboxylate transporter substrate binding protein [Ramlibacter agri]NML45063.1 tripartite tricarboxylate transporter substrate binding protein [Ramlibacter agri]
MHFARPTRRWLGKGLLAGLFAAFAATSALAEYPDKPIQLVVPFAAGGSLDVTARIIADRLKEKDLLGQPVIINNRPGAGSAVGARAVASAAPDGYTLFFTSGSAFGYLHMLVPNLDLKLDDFVSVAAVAVNPSVIVATNKLPVKSLQELANYPKPGEISFCSTGANGLNHLQLEMFKRAVKAKTGREFNVTHVPYNGLAPALTAVREGSIHACVLPYASLVKQLNGKDLRVLAVQSHRRLPWLPDVPTTGQQGFPELDGNDAFVNVQAPKGTPPAVVARLEQALEKAMQDPTVRKKLEELEVQVAWMNSRETQKWLQEDVRRLGTVIREAGLEAK